MQQENGETECPLHGRLQTLIFFYFTQFALNFFPLALWFCTFTPLSSEVAAQARVIRYCLWKSLSSPIFSFLPKNYTYNKDTWQQSYQLLVFYLKSQNIWYFPCCWGVQRSKQTEKSVILNAVIWRGEEADGAPSWVTVVKKQQWADWDECCL